jgi:solute:Na+ symporter, SSS family
MAEPRSAIFGLAPLDLAVVAAYVAAVIGIGTWARLRTRTQEQYFLGGRRFGKVMQAFASFGQVATPDGPVGVVTTTFHNGIAGVWSSLLFVFCTPLFWIASPWLRRMRTMTMGDFYVERYGSRPMAATYVVIAAIGMAAVLSAGYVATAMTTLAIAHGMFSWLTPGLVIGAACAVTILNAVMGGLAAAFYTTVLQGGCILALSTLLIPFGLAKINRLYGGHGAGAALATLHKRLPEAYFHIFGSSALPDFTWYYVLAVAAVAGLTTMTQPNQLVTNAAARDESAARFGMVTGSLVKRVCTILWGLAGLIAALLYADSLRNSDLVWGYASRDLLGPAGWGLVGLMLVGMLSALMAVSNSLLLTMSGLITRNLYRPIRPGKSERHYIAVGRVSGVLFLVGSAVLATQFDALFDLLKFTWEFFTVFSAAFWLGLKWRRANRAGAWASILVTALGFYAVPLVLPVAFPALRSNPTLALETQPRAINPAGGAQSGLVRGEPTLLPARSIFWSQGLARDAAGNRLGRGYPYLDLLLIQAMGFDLRRNSCALNETIRIIIRLLLPFIVLAAVARFTLRDEEAMLGRFFVKMRTQVTSGGADDAAKLVEALRNPEHLRETKVFPDSDWEIYRWSRQDAAGFIFAIGLVLAIVGLLKAVASYTAA